MAEQGLPFGRDIEAPLLTDITVESAMDSARATNLDLRVWPDPSEEERQEILNRLNERWPRFDDPVTVSGRVRMPKLEIEDDMRHNLGQLIVAADTSPSSPEDEIVFIAEEERLTSYGFQMVEVDGVVLDSDDSIKIYAVQLLFTKEVEYKLASDRDEDLPRRCDVECLADLDEVVLAFPRNSDEHDEYIAFEYFKDFIAEVVGRFMECETLSEKLQALHGLEVDYPHYLDDPERDTLATYLAEQLGLAYDSEPFYCKFDAETLLYHPQATPEDDIEVFRGRHARIKLCGVELPLKAGSDRMAKNRLLETRLLLRFLDRDAKKDSGVYSVRLSDMVALAAFRDIDPASIFGGVED